MTRYESARDRTRRFLGGRTFGLPLSALIITNVITVMLETVDDLPPAATAVFLAIELASVAIFTAEYVARLWSVGPGLTPRVRFIFSFFALLDLLAILPFYVPAVLAMDLRFLRAIRLVRLVRVLKLARYSQSLRLLGAVFRSKKSDLTITAFVVLILLVCASSALYIAEHEAQPESFSSIPAALWWGVVTLTTVGYGDIYPITLAGKVIGALVAFLGIGMFALPTGILASGFTREVERSRSAAGEVCPGCGRPLDVRARPRSAIGGGQ
jgi:voltage-gated potassium channel